jgi:hypothetical protein
MRPAAALVLVALAGCGGGSRRATTGTAPSHAAVSRATDRFPLDLADVPALRRNRLIDEAAAAVVGVCRDCFLALEAERPIPALAGGSACP